MCYAFDDGEVKTWTPDQPFPIEVRQHTGEIRAHNAAFERLIFWYVLEMPFKLEQFYCTAAQARANCLPGSLEDVGRAISSKMRKDYRGAELIRKLSIPREDGTFNEDPALMQEMIDYCAQDVRTMREISKAMRQLTPQELLDYHVSERINDRGLLIDKPLCEAAAKYATDEATDLDAKVKEITEGAITSVRSPVARQWVWDRLSDDARKLMKSYKDGEEKVSIDKSVRANLLALAEENSTAIPEDVATVIACMDAIWASSTAKFSRMAAVADEEDHRARGAFVFAGGSATGRYSSYAIQMHNLPRKCAEDPESLRSAILRGHSLVPKYGKRVSDALKGMLRPAIMAPKGRKLIALDWSGIEARVTPWITGDPRAEETLDIFRAGKDVYISTAAAMFNKREDEVTKADRMLGKVAVLACGFGGSVGAFASMGRIYGVTLPEPEAKRMVALWRKANPWAQPFWRALEDSYMRAMRNPGRSFSVGKVAYLRQGDHLWYSLPSGRVLCYPLARFDDEGAVTYLKAAFKPAADAKEWPRSRLWFGLAAENIVQATANCLLRHALRQMDAERIQVVGSVHDEIIVECDESLAESTKQRMIEIMTCAPEWANGLPLDVEGTIMDRFTK